MSRVPVRMVQAVRSESEAIVAENTLRDCIAKLASIRGSKTTQSLLADHIGNLAREGRPK